MRYRSFDWSNLMTDRAQTFTGIASAIFAMRSAVLGWMNVSNNGPIFGIDTRNPLGFNATNNSLSVEH